MTNIHYIPVIDNTCGLSIIKFSDSVDLDTANNWIRLKTMMERSDEVNVRIGENRIGETETTQTFEDTSPVARKIVETKWPHVRLFC